MVALDSNAKQNIPQVFTDIMRWDEKEPTIPSGPDISLQQWRIFRQEWKKWAAVRVDYVRAAEQILKWNTDKGSKG